MQAPLQGPPLAPPLPHGAASPSRCRPRRPALRCRLQRMPPVPPAGEVGRRNAERTAVDSAAGQSTGTHRIFCTLSSWQAVFIAGAVAGYLLFTAAAK